MSFRLQCLDDSTGAKAQGRATCDSATTATNVAHVAHVAPVARATPCDNPNSVAHVALSHALPPPAATPLLADFRAALVLGRLVVCGNCAHFTPGIEPATVGHCRQFGTEAWPFAPFICSGFTVRSAAAAPAYLPDPDGGRAIASTTPAGRPAYHDRRVS